MSHSVNRLCTIAALVCLALALAGTAGATVVGSIFLTGHDPDFHAFLGGNTTGARDLLHTGIGFVTDPTFNPFATGGAKFLFVENTTIGVPGGHSDGINGLNAAGYVQGVNYDVAGTAAALTADLALLGNTYDAIVIGSDFGGLLTEDQLDVLVSNSATIINFLNAGGGVFAMSEGVGSGFGLTTDDPFKFLPFVVTSAGLNQSEVGNTLTAFGSSLGLVSSDINGNASHNIFTGTGGLSVVDNDAQGNILTIAGRGQVSTTGIVPEPSTMLLLGTGLLGGFFRRRKK